ncbi:hypothetical protein [uncultured Paraglaciecola sp.]|uniref:hypothetical protein n=1 Tax=uncultured Paraglaciecola sp. TaxID=1765024 RepID=UPI002626EA3E|nr:hypothetical protein [uncultured Paraglaciecola sp.]
MKTTDTHYCPFCDRDRLLTEWDTCSKCGRNFTEGMDEDKLLEVIKGHRELIKFLLHWIGEIENLQNESYGFINDDKKVAELFRMRMPVIQGLDSSLMVRRVHEYVEKNSFDKKAAGEAVRQIDEFLKEED